VAEKRSDVEIVRDQLTREVTNDAYSIADDIFRRPEPDVARMTNDQIDARYRQAYQAGDRQYLISEAQRDPRQFLEATQRLGVQMPSEQPLEPQLALPRQAQGAAPLPPQAQPPLAPPPPPVIAPPTPLAMPGSIATPGQPVPPSVPQVGI